jgi:tetratricopeptide (TPR) repeat protein
MTISRVTIEIITFGTLTFAALSWAPAIQGQIEELTVERPRGIPPEANWVHNDYFQKDKDPEVNGRLRNVETNHFGKTNFWKWYSAGNLEYSLNELRFVLWVFPNHPGALLMMGAIAKSTKRLSLGTAHYEKALRLFPQHALIHAQYGFYLTDIGQVDIGIARIEQAIQMDPKLVAPYVWLARVYYKVGKPDLARSAAEEARKLGYQGKIPGEPSSK